MFYEAKATPHWLVQCLSFRLYRAVYKISPGIRLNSPSYTAIVCLISIFK